MELSMIFGPLMTIGAFLVAIVVIVAVHEYGHLAIGRLCGIEAEVFSVGMGKALMSRRDRRGTVWQLSPILIGGYVKYRGDADMASASAAGGLELSPAERRKTFHGAPVWARICAVLGGPGANFLFSLIIFAVLAMLQGRPTEDLVVAELTDGPWEVQELRAGDLVLGMGDVRLPLSEGLSETRKLPDTVTITYQIERDGALMSVRAPHPFPPVADFIVPRSAADDSGMRPGDVILSVDGERIGRFDELREQVEGGAGAPLTLGIWRQGDELDVVLTPRPADELQADGSFTRAWRIGIVARPLISGETQTIGPIEALGVGADSIMRVISGSLSGIANMVTGAISSCNISGPIGIAEASASMAGQGVMRFVSFIALLSVAIGMMNLFPIPVLDGGHIMLLAYEGIVGRPPHPRVGDVLTAFGLALIGGLMLFAVFNDLVCP